MDIIRTFKNIQKTSRFVAASPILTGAALGTAVFVADQLFKGSVELQPEGTFPHDVGEKGILSKVEFENFHNKGIAMSAFDEDPEKAEKLALTATAVAAVSLATRDSKDRLGKISDLVLLGGAASNLYDRRKRGYVVDYIHVKEGPLSKIVFNIGDAAIALGTAVGSLCRALSES